jgi:ribose transport system substrate-binding protein
MKKGLNIVMLLALILVLLSGCGSAKTTSRDTGTKSNATKTASSDNKGAGKVKIGILAPAVTHGWVAAVAYNAEARAKELGDKVDYKIETSSNAAEMTSQLDDLKTWGAQAIVAFPQWEGMETPIQQAVNAGIKVVNFDIKINANGVYRVAGDNTGMGVQGAKYIVDKIGKKGTVVMLEVPSAGSVSELRKQGFVDTMKQMAPDMKILSYATKFTREDGLKDFADILTKNPKIDAVYSMDDETSIGVLQAIKEAGRTDIKVVTGGGGMQEYFKMMPKNQNIWLESALYSPAMVKEAVNEAVDLLSGKDVPKETTIPTTVVDRTNYTKYLDANSPY